MEGFEGIEHKFIDANGIKMHVAEMGQGPIVLLVHGFPELWYSWRHQILYLAAHGYRAVAPDLRGYGDTTGAPVDDHTKFTTMHAVGDLVALIDAIGGGDKKVFVVGHDWGAHIAWRLCLFRPDKVKALISLSVPFTPRNPGQKPVQIFHAAYGEDHYICRFQETGGMEGVFASLGTKKVVTKFLTYRDPQPFYFPKDKPFGDAHDTQVILPAWLSEEDIDYYTHKFDQTGFTGGINYYRCFDLNWELEAPWTEAKINVPVKFVVGELDLVYSIPGVKEYIHNGGFHKYVPMLEEVVVIKGAAHFITQEVPDKVNKNIYDFLQKF
uniref:epoxide hydrolase A-like n=1 Tax=Erigeron canadensis TaxID=72917 RepID=UPI001CB89A0C|nr:epoxide hydrolase A-like [Erigeron canadensis]